jgi:hypothetical protein
LTEIVTDIVQEGQRLLDAARAEAATLALLGGVAVRIRAHSVPTSLSRQYKDLDFAVPKGTGRDVSKLLREAGYEADTGFNAMNANHRMLFHDLVNDRQVDVFVGSFRMCHEIAFANRLTPGDPTVPLAELILMKLQVVELNEKDVRDTVLLLFGHEVADHDGDAVNGARIASLCADDWGLWRTITANLDRCRDLVGNYDLADEDAKRVQDRLSSLEDRIEREPKSRGWRLRARIGERKRWYELPEEVGP